MPKCDLSIILWERVTILRRVCLCHPLFLTRDAYRYEKSCQYYRDIVVLYRYLYSIYRHLQKLPPSDQFWCTVTKMWMPTQSHHAEREREMYMTFWLTLEIKTFILYVCLYVIKLQKEAIKATPSIIMSSGQQLLNFQTKLKVRKKPPLKMSFFLWNIQRVKWVMNKQTNGKKDKCMEWFPSCSSPSPMCKQFKTVLQSPYCYCLMTVSYHEKCDLLKLKQGYNRPNLKPKKVNQLIMACQLLHIIFQEDQLINLLRLQVGPLGGHNVSCCGEDSFRGDTCGGNGQVHLCQSSQ